MEGLEERIKELISVLKKLKKEASEDKLMMSQKGFKDKCQITAKSWFNEISADLSVYSINQEVLESYNTQFERLLKLSAGNNRTTSYNQVFNVLLKNIKNTLLIPVQKSGVVSIKSNKTKELLDKIEDEIENEYLLEALNCWENGFFRASVVLGWCGAIDRIHRKIEELGFDKFNNMSESLYDRTSGRYKRFKKKFSVNSISELRQVFDNDILWIIEGLGFIDINQHTRLTGCFNLRNHCGHPGEAPVTEYNVLSPKQWQ